MEVPVRVSLPPRATLPRDDVEAGLGGGGPIDGGTFFEKRARRHHGRWGAEGANRDPGGRGGGGEGTAAAACCLKRKRVTDEERWGATELERGASARPFEAAGAAIEAGIESGGAWFSALGDVVAASRILLRGDGST